MDCTFYRKHTDPRGKTRHEYIHVGSSAAFLRCTSCCARKSGPHLPVRAFAASPLTPATHGLPAGIGLFPGADE